ncbi:MAG TPA: hypothetical protein VFU11_06875, partial [Solirubrobacterales bacterium]|nr:hypothetical protein [Solirubrobacterales bacterium]
MSVSTPGLAPFTVSALDALESAAETVAGGAVGTFDILTALIAGDPSGAWERVQLHASWIDVGDRNRFLDASPGPEVEWSGILLTPTAAEG